MSVYASKRKQSPIKYVDGAKNIVNITSKIMTSKKVPKSYRFIISVPAVKSARNILKNIRISRAIFPSDLDLADLKRKYIGVAIGECYTLLDDLDRCVWLEITSVGEFRDLVFLISDEIKILKQVYKNISVINE